MFLNDPLPKKITMYTLPSARNDRTKFSFKPSQFLGLFIDLSPDWEVTLRLEHDGCTEEYTISDADAFRLMWVYAILKAKFIEEYSADEKRILLPRWQPSGC